MLDEKDRYIETLKVGHLKRRHAFIKCFLWYSKAGENQVWEIKKRQIYFETCRYKLDRASKPPGRKKRLRNWALKGDMYEVKADSQMVNIWEGKHSVDETFSSMSLTLSIKRPSEHYHNSDLTDYRGLQPFFPNLVSSFFLVFQVLRMFEHEEDIAHPNPNLNCRCKKHNFPWLMEHSIHTVDTISSQKKH